MSDINTVIEKTNPASDDDIFKYRKTVTGTISQTLQKEDVGDLEELLKKINNYDDTFFENRAKEEQKRKEEQAKRREEELEKRKEEYYEERINKEQEYLAQIDEEEELEKEEKNLAAIGFTERFLNIKKYLTKEKEKPMSEKEQSVNTEMEPETADEDRIYNGEQFIPDQSDIDGIPDDVDLSEIVGGTIGEVEAHEDEPEIPEIPEEDPIKQTEAKELFDITDAHEPTLEEKEEEIAKNHKKNFLKGIFIKDKKPTTDTKKSPVDKKDVSENKEEKSSEESNELNFEKMSDKEYDEYLSEEQTNLKKRIKDEHSVTPAHSVNNICLRIREEQEQGSVEFILLTTPDFNTLFIFENVNKFLEVASEVNNNIDFSYLYVVLRRGALYLGYDEYDDKITAFFTGIGNELKRMKNEMYLDFTDPEDFAKIKTIEGINIFKNIYVT